MEDVIFLITWKPIDLKVMFDIQTACGASDWCSQHEGSIYSICQSSQLFISWWWLLNNKINRTNNASSEAVMESIQVQGLKRLCVYYLIAKKQGLWTANVIFGEFSH